MIIGVTADGVKEPVAIQDGERESTQSWRELLVDMKARGLTAPKLAIGDGALGFWSALAEQFPTTRTQRCWVHKTANVLNHLPKSEHAHAKSKLHDIWQASTRAEAEKAFDVFIRTYEQKHPKATACLVKDREALLAFYDFPADHWQHIRTTNPIESTFATVRLRTSRTKGHGSHLAAITLAFKLIEYAAKNWRGSKVTPKSSKSSKEPPSKTASSNSTTPPESQPPSTTFGNSSNSRLRLSGRCGSSGG